MIPRTGEFMSFVTMTSGAPALRGSPGAWNASGVVQADKVIVLRDVQIAGAVRFARIGSASCG
jgi:hypothetical protein